MYIGIGAAAVIVGLLVWLVSGNLLFGIIALIVVAILGGGGGSYYGGRRRAI